MGHLVCCATLIHFVDYLLLAVAKSFLLIDIDVAEGLEMLEVSEDVDLLGAMIGLMSTADVERGLELARLAASAGLTATSSKLGEAGVELTVQGIVETEAGLALGDAAREMAVEGVEEVAEGVAELGTAATLEVEEEV